YEAALPIDFSRTNLFLDPASLRGPDAEQNVASADLESALSQAATVAYGPGAKEMFGDGATNELTRQIVRNPDILNGRVTLWLPLGSRLDIAAKHKGDAASEKLIDMLSSRQALRRTFNTGFLTSSDSTDPSSVGVWGALKGSF